MTGHLEGHAFHLWHRDRIAPTAPVQLGILGAIDGLCDRTRTARPHRMPRSSRCWRCLRRPAASAAAPGSSSTLSAFV